MQDKSDVEVVTLGPRAQQALGRLIAARDMHAQSYQQTASPGKRATGYHAPHGTRPTKDRSLHRMTVWRTLHWLGGQLESLTRQRDAPPFEVVIADNGSADGTLGVAIRFAERLALKIVGASDR